MNKVSTDDWVAISDMMGEYCWLVDAGDGLGWAGLYTPDGEFAGFTPEPLKGPEQLRTIPENAFRDYGNGQMRHVVANMTMRYGESRDVVNARFYNYVSVWGGAPGAGNFVMALCEAIFVRNGDGWLIKRNSLTLLTP